MSYGRLARSKPLVKPIQSVVGVERFELPTSCSQSKRATGLRYTPKGLDYRRYGHRGSIRIALNQLRLLFRESSNHADRLRDRVISLP